MFEEMEMANYSDLIITYCIHISNNHTVPHKCNYHVSIKNKKQGWRSGLSGRAPA
jgi:hypothetical protein